MNGAKMAALKLNTLNQSDRQWILDKLDDESRVLLQQRLQELQSMPAQLLQFDDVLEELERAESTDKVAAVEDQIWSKAGSLNLDAVFAGMSVGSLSVFCMDVTPDRRETVLAALPAVKKDALRQLFAAGKGQASPAVKNSIREFVFSQSGC